MKKIYFMQQMLLMLLGFGWSAAASACNFKKQSNFQFTLLVSALLLASAVEAQSVHRLTQDGLPDNGYIVYENKSNGIVFSVKYDWGGEFHEGLAVVLKKDKYGYIDEMGREVIKCKYLHALDFSEGIAFVTLKKAPYGSFIYAINKEGDLLFCLKQGSTMQPYGTNLFYSDGLAFWSDFAYDKSGKRLFSLREKLAKYNIVSGTNTIRRRELKERGGEGNVLEFWPSSCNRIRFLIKTVKLVGRYEETIKRVYGFVDIKGNEVIPAIYEDAEDFVDGYAKVKINGIWSVIDIDGNYSTKDVNK